MKFATKALVGTGMMAVASLAGFPLTAGAAPTAAASTPAAAATGQPSTVTCLPATLAAAQQLVLAELTGRVGQLNGLLAAVDDTSNQLTASDRQTLQNDIGTV